MLYREQLTELKDNEFVKVQIDKFINQKEKFLKNKLKDFFGENWGDFLEIDFVPNIGYIAKLKNSSFYFVACDNSNHLALYKLFDDNNRWIIGYFESGMGFAKAMADLFKIYKSYEFHQL